MTLGTEVHRMIERVFASQMPDTADGPGLDSLAAITGLVRETTAQVDRERSSTLEWVSVELPPA